MTKPSLHVEIEDILAGMTSREISDLVNQRGRYRNLKGQAGTTTPSQISARVSKPAFPKYRRYSVRREGDSAIRIMKL